MAPTTASKSVSSIHPIYKIYFLYLDPIFALGGAYLILTDPTKFLISTIPDVLIPQIPTSISPLITLLLTNIAALYVYIALSMAGVLWVTSELDVWKAVIRAMVVSDVGHLGALWWAAPERMLEVVHWTFEEGVNVGILSAGLALRVAFLLGIGKGR